MKKTAIIGASTNPGRYAYIAAGMLTEYGHPIVPIGIHPGEIYGEPILDFRKKPPVEDLDTMTLYLSPKNQKEWYDYLLSLNPKQEYKSHVVISVTSRRWDILMNSAIALGDQELSFPIILSITVFRLYRSFR